MKQIKGRTVCFDVDDTLIMWDHERYPELEKITISEGDNSITFAVHKKHVQFLKTMKLIGFKVVVWSASGNSWADKIINTLGLEKYVSYTMSKPEFVLDDLEDPMEIINRILYFDPATNKKR